MEVSDFNSTPFDEAVTLLFSNEGNIETQFAELLKTKADLMNETRIRYICDKAKTLKLPAKTVNNLGVVLSKSELRDNLKAIQKEFYEVAAEKGESQGYHNYAECILEEDPRNALIYARKAVKLTRDEGNFSKHKHKDILYKALKENSKSILDGAKGAMMDLKAGEALIDFIEYCARVGCVERARDFIHAELEHVIGLVKLTHDQWERLKSINDSLLELILIEILRKTGETQEAWKLYRYFDQKSRFYENAIEEAKTLISSTVEDYFCDQSNGGHSTCSVSSPNAVPSCYVKNWRKESKWFDSVDPRVNEKLKIDLRRIDERIRAQKVRISRSNEGDDLAEELAQLNRLKADLDDLGKYRMDWRVSSRRHEAERRFFDPKRSKKRAELIHLVREIVVHRYQPKEKKDPPDEKNLQPIRLRGRSARLLITAERLFQETIIVLSGNKGNAVLGIPFLSKSVDGDVFMCLGPVERYVIDETNVECQHCTETAGISTPFYLPPDDRRLGCSICLGIGSYDEICDFFMKLTNHRKESEQKLAGWMIQFAKNHERITCVRLKEIYENANDDDADCLNKCCFLIIEKEQAQFQSGTGLIKCNDIQIGMSVAQARCLIMIRDGFLDFEDTLKTNTAFGVYSHQNMMSNFDEVKESCKKIEKLYKNYLRIKHARDYMKFAKGCIKNDFVREFVLTREQAHQDLREVYGGETDSSGEEYLSDIEDTEEMQGAENELHLESSLPLGKKL